MCGICGVYEYGGKRRVDRDELQRMNDAIRHRGPDDEGFFVRNDVGLGVRRLSIIDIAGGHQPIANDDESCWIVFNGEIYNYQKLRDDLLEKGHKFRTKSDTEVVLHLYEHYGADCVNLLDGMFAFAIYDRRNSAPESGRLLIARDRLGKKPLYYTDVDDCLLFSSELKALLRDGRVRKEIDPEAVSQYLSMLVVPAPRSIFKQVKKLPAGHTLECDADGIRVRRYWNYVDYVKEERMAEGEAVAEVRRLFFAAVEKRLIGEVPVGAFLSGGMDSSAVVGAMSRLTGQRVKTFSIGFEGPQYFNELPYAKMLAEHYGTEHHEFLVSPDIMKLLPEVVCFADEPMAIHSTIALYILSEAMHGKAKVVLTGDGGDEIFSGYEHYIYEKRVAAYDHLPRQFDGAFIWSSSLLASLTRNRNAQRFHKRLSRFVTNARKSVVARRLDLRGGFSAEEIERLCLRSSRETAMSSARLLEQYYAMSNGVRQETKVNVLDILVWLPDEMLAKVDRMTMAHSVEARCPFMDWHLVEYLARVPASLKLPGWGKGSLKSLFRSALGDLFPEKLLNRPKHTFDLPLDVWFRGGARDYLEEMLSRERIRRQGIFDPDVVAGLVSRHHAGQADEGGRIFTLLVFQIWADTVL